MAAQTKDSGLQQAMQKQAAAAAVLPIRVDIRPALQGARAGDDVELQILLRDNYNRPVPAVTDTAVRVTLTAPSGAKETRKITFYPGEAVHSIDFQTREAGAIKLSVKQQEDRLLGGTNYLLVRPPVKSDTAPLRSAPSPAVKFRSMQFDAASPAPLFQTAFYQPRPAAPATASFILSVSGERDNEIRANGKTYARIQVFYMGETTLRAPVKIFLSATHGTLSDAAFVVDPTTGVGEVHWTSTVIARDARVRIIPDAFTVEPQDAGVHFVEPILGVMLVRPPVSISLIDNTSLTARFFDDAGNPVNTTVKRHVSFVSDNPILRLSPEVGEIPPDSAEVRTLLKPASWVSSIIEVSTPGYPPARQPIEVTVFKIILLCLAGGLLGGLASYWNSQPRKQLSIRLLGGLIVALAASWVDVFLGVPHMDSGIAHTQISVLFVSLFAAFAAFAGLGWLSKLGKGSGLNF